MAELIQENWVLLAIALVIGLLVAWWVVAANRTARVERSGTADAVGAAKRNQALIDTPPAATAADASASVKPAAPPATGGGDDLTQIKGLGPKLRAQLGEMGITSFAQIAGWDDAEIDRIDAQLGRFQGRIRRDNWVEQAKLLCSGDKAAYEDRFGRS